MDGQFQVHTCYLQPRSSQWILALTWFSKYGLHCYDKTQHYPSDPTDVLCHATQSSVCAVRWCQGRCNCVQWGWLTQVQFNLETLTNTLHALVDESNWKGAHYITSMLHHSLVPITFGEANRLHPNNCSGQNKNRCYAITCVADLVWPRHALLSHHWGHNVLTGLVFQFRQVYRQTRSVFICQC